ELFVGGVDAGGAEGGDDRGGEGRGKQGVGRGQDEEDAGAQPGEVGSGVELVGGGAEDDERVRIEDVGPAAREAVEGGRARGRVGELGGEDVGHAVAPEGVFAQRGHGVDHRAGGVAAGVPGGVGGEAGAEGVYGDRTGHARGGGDGD